MYFENTGFGSGTLRVVMAPGTYLYNIWILPGGKAQRPCPPRDPASHPCNKKMDSASLRYLDPRKIIFNLTQTWVVTSLLFVRESTRPELTLTGRKAIVPKFMKTATVLTPVTTRSRSF